MSVTGISPKSSTDKKAMRTVLIGAFLGSCFEWYDFFLYTALVVFFSELFFPKANPTAALLSSFATYGVAFVIRPFGALLFGRLGDLVGRKYTFLLTIILMGIATMGIGLLPTFEQIGWVAPVMLLLLRLMQGLSLSGEYSGAITYVAEHVGEQRRGYQTSWMQAGVSVGNILSVMAVLASRWGTGREQFARWGWRLPFLFSIVLLAISVFIRLRMEESPVFNEMKRARKQAKAPILETFSNLTNVKFLLIAFLMVVGQVVIGYMRVYLLIFMLAVLKLEDVTAYLLITVGNIIAVPLSVLSGWWSDVIGRKWIMLGGCLLAALTFFPIFKGLTHYANPALESAQARTPVSVASSDCHVHLFNTPNLKLSPCDQVKGFLTSRGVTYKSLPGVGGDEVVITIGDRELKGFDPKQIAADLAAAGYPEKADPEKANLFMVELLIVVLSLYQALTFGPLGAFLTEQFPARVRYTSVSVAYNFGAGWVGGLTPFFVTALSVSAGNIYYGIWFPVIVCAVVFTLGALLVKETKDYRIRDI